MEALLEKLAETEKRWETSEKGYHEQFHNHPNFGSDFGFAHRQVLLRAEADRLRNNFASYKKSREEVKFLFENICIIGSKKRFYCGPQIKQNQFAKLTTLMQAIEFNLLQNPI